METKIREINRKKGINEELMNWLLHWEQLKMQTGKTGNYGLNGIHKYVILERE